MNARHWGGVGRQATGSSPTKRPTVRDGRAKAAQVPLARRQASERARKRRLRPCTRATASACPAPTDRTRPCLVPAGGLPNIQRSAVQPTRTPPDAVLCCPHVLLVIGGPGPGCLNPRRARGTGDQILAPPARPVGRTRTGRARGTRAHRRAACRAWLPACPRSSPPCE